MQKVPNTDNIVHHQDLFQLVLSNEFKLRLDASCCYTYLIFISKMFTLCICKIFISLLANHKQIRNGTPGNKRLALTPLHSSSDFLLCAVFLHFMKDIRYLF